MNSKLCKQPVMALLLTAILCATAVTFPTSFVTARPQNQSITLSGLRDRVTVRRDERGIPYIEAANDDDLYFAQGYVTASDRLWQMDLLRRPVRGELSEIFGRVTLEEDRRHRRYGFAVIADATFAQASPTMRA